MQVSATGSTVHASTNRPQGVAATGKAKPDLLSRFELASQILGLASSRAVSSGDREVAAGRTGSSRAVPVDASGRTAAKAAGRTVAAVLDGLDAAALRVLPLKPGQVVRDLVHGAASGDVQRAVQSYAADTVRAGTSAVATAAVPMGTLPRTISDAPPALGVPDLAPTADADGKPRPQGPGEVAVTGPGQAERGKAKRSEMKRGKVEHGPVGRDRAEHPHPHKHPHSGQAGPAHPAGPHGAGHRDAQGPGTPEGKAAHDARDGTLPAAPGGATAATKPAPDAKPDPRAVAAQPWKDASVAKPATESKPAVEAKPATDTKPALRAEAAPPAKAARPAPQAAKAAPETSAPEKTGTEKTASERTAPAKPAAVSAAVKSYKGQ
ncbi:hypothetical protein SAMN02799631_05575 [Methylobacterium sp. 174MFSha1.1]|uniref:hypothetical protein n=1 Tax=Methylobacterium sp. 174MFSha1.1 TaxID=1502749 RepID=UPI0008F0CD78|nr:hypothetical protein [Methylobacterium sp. 174MFSha1.1]SFV12896.1 hypothetical protein SAMN02799631_05575 [Methylobacterium sp. 174MFSha1.1]